MSGEKLKQFEAILGIIATGAVVFVVRNADLLFRATKSTFDDGARAVTKASRHIPLGDPLSSTIPELIDPAIPRAAHDAALAAQARFESPLAKLPGQKSWAGLVQAEITPKDIAATWKQPRFQDRKWAYNIESMRKQIDAEVLIEALRQREPQSVVRSHEILGLLPDSKGVGFEKIFGTAEPSAAQLNEFGKIYAATGIEPVEAGFGRESLFEVLRNSPSDRLNILVCHNAGDEKNVVIALPSGDKLPLEELRSEAKNLSRNFVIICCHARESGIDQTITAAQAMTIARKLAVRVQGEAVTSGQESASSGYHMVEILEWLNDAALSTTRRARNKQVAIIFGATGSGTTVLALRVNQVRKPQSGTSNGSTPPTNSVQTPR